MKISYKILCLIILSCIIFTCSKKKYREEIIERYSNGEKKIVVKYQGYGNNEKLIERKTYDENGELILLEDKFSNIKKTYVDMHPELMTKEGLLSYLQGEWDFGKIQNDSLTPIGSTSSCLIECGNNFVYKEIYINNSKYVFEYKLKIKSSVRFSRYWHKEKPVCIVIDEKIKTIFKGDLYDKARRRINLE